MQDSSVIVFARAPVPGATKTRLVPALGAEGAAELHKRLVQRMLVEAIAAEVGPVELCCTPDTNHPFFANCARQLRITLHAQVGEDLGARMNSAFVRSLAQSNTVLLVGSDIPALEARHLWQARLALDEADAVFIPAEDGGYVLVGLSQPQPRLFLGIPWGGEQAMEQTRRRVAEAGLRIAVLEPLWDLDQPADLARVEPALLAGLVRS